MSENPSPQAFLSATVDRVNSRAEKFAGINWNMAYDFTADDNGTWYFRIVDGVAQPVVAGVHEAPTVTVSGKYSVFFDVMTGKSNVAVAFMTGKLKSKGDNKAGQQFAKMME